MLTLIHRTPYCFSYQPTCMPFPSAQCENHIWIRSAGKVSISFLLWRGDQGHRVHCEGVQRKAGAEGGSSGSIQPERCVLLRSFYALFAPKQRKRTTFAFYKRTQQSFTFSRPDSITNMHSWASLLLKVTSVKS